jgi:hypothetical protein
MARMVVPAWVVQMDGESAAILRLCCVLVKIAAGAHTFPVKVDVMIRFRHRPWLSGHVTFVNLNQIQATRDVIRDGVVELNVTRLPHTDQGDVDIGV